MNASEHLNNRFSALGHEKKVALLAHVIHETTIAARMSYIPTSAHPQRTFGQPDGAVLRDAMNFIHRVSEYMLALMGHGRDWGQGESVFESITDHFDHDAVSKWIEKFS